MTCLSTRLTLKIFGFHSAFNLSWPFSILNHLYFNNYRAQISWPRLAFLSFLRFIVVLLSHQRRICLNTPRLHCFSLWASALKPQGSDLRPGPNFRRPEPQQTSQSHQQTLQLHHQNQAALKFER